MTRKIILFIVAVVTVLNSGALLWLHYKVEKIVVIDVLKVFNEYELKKESEKKIEEQLMVYQNKIDSLQAIAKKAYENHDQQRLEKAEQVLQQLSGEFQAASEYAAKNLNEVVWKRLNPLINEFGKKHSYRVVIGANGMGTVLYNDESVDRTDELIMFINQKYQNGK